MSSFHYDQAEWNLASHSLQELPTEPIGIWHTMWPINVPKAHKKMGPDLFFSKHGWGRCGKDEDDSLCRSL